MTRGCLQVWFVRKKILMLWNEVRLSLQVMHHLQNLHYCSWVLKDQAVNYFWGRNLRLLATMKWLRVADRIYWKISLRNRRFVLLCLFFHIFFKFQNIFFQVTFFIFKFSIFLLILLSGLFSNIHFVLLKFTIFIPLKMILIQPHKKFLTLL